MKRLINLFIFQILTFVSFSQTRTTSGDAIRKEITPKYVNGVIKQLTIAQLKAQAITNGDSTTLYYVTDSGKKGYFELDKNDNSSVGNDSTVIVTNNGKRLKRTIEQYLAHSTTGKYYRGDKTWQDLNKSSVGLSNVDNTSDLNKPISTAAQTALLGKLDKGYSVSELRGLSNSVLAATQIFYCNEVGKEGFWRYDASDNSSVDNLGTILVTSGGKRLKRIYNNVIYPEWFGAVSDGNTNSTSSFQNAVDFLYSAGGGTIYVNKIYRVNSLNIKKRVNIKGVGADYSKLRFIPSGIDSIDAITSTVIWSGSFSKISDIAIDGYNSNGYYIGNGLSIVPDDSGLDRRVLENVNVGFFAAYKKDKIGGNFGVNKNFSRSDISNGNGEHLLLGGNAIIIAKNSNPAWNLIAQNITILDCDGIGFDIGKASDSKFSNISIGSCVNMGINMDQDNKNNIFSNVKVFLCRILNPTDSYLEKLNLIAPHELTISSEKYASVILTGSNHQLKNFEVQECGSHGVQLGNEKYNISNSDIQVVVDGNGGYDSSLDSVSMLNYRRYGVILKNYYAINLYGTADDFRAKFLLPRQARGIHIISKSSKPRYYAISTITQDNNYKIADNSGGADFTPFQANYTYKSNNIGTIFQARTTYNGSFPPVNFGTGYLSAINDYSYINFNLVNQFEQTQGGAGYDTSGDDGNSYIVINSKLIQSKSLSTQNISSNSLTSKTGNALVLGADGPNSIIISTNGSTKAQIYNTGNMYIGSSPTDNGDKLNVDGTINISAKIKIPTGTNKSVGTLTLASGLGTITSTAITTNSIIWITTKTLSGTSAHDYTYNISSAGTATITARQNNGSTETGCNSTIQYWIIN